MLIRSSLPPWLPALCLGGSLAAQSITSGTLAGRVRQASTGAPVSLATLTLRNPETGWSRTLSAEADGSFRFQAVPVGGYELTAIAPGLLTRRIGGLRVRLGGGRDTVVLMEAAVASALVEVLGAASGIELVETSLVTHFPAETLDLLPTAARNLSDLALFAPGAASTPGGLVSMEGARASQNHLMVDGMTSTSAYYGQPFGVVSESFLFSLGTVQEVQVLSEAFDAQFGEATGAIVNALTRSGTNQFKGQLLLLERPEALAARMRPVDHDPDGLTNAPEHLRSHFSSRTLNAVVSGPLVKDRAHYLLGVERKTYQDTYYPTSFVQDYEGYRRLDLEGWKAALGDRLQVGEGGRTWTEDAGRPYRRSGSFEALFGKVDARFGEKHTLTARIHATRWEDAGAGVWFAGESSTVSQANRTFSGSLAWQSLFASNVVHEARAHWISERSTVLPAPGGSPEIVVQGFLEGQDPGTPNRFSESILELNDVWHASFGDRLLKAGFDLKRIRATDDHLPYQRGGFEFPSYRTASGWATGHPDPVNEIRYVQSYRSVAGSDRLGEGLHAVFVQAQFQNLFRPGLEVQVGLRGTWQTWDTPVLPNPLLAGTDTPGNAHRLDPRLSFLWRPGGPVKWLLRGGVGQFSSPNLGVQGLLARTWNGLASGQLDLWAPAGDPRFVSGFLSPSARLNGDRLTALDPDFLARYLLEVGNYTLHLWDPDQAMATVTKAALEAEWEPDPRWTLKGRLSASRTRNLAYWINVNLAQCDVTGHPVPGAHYRDGYPTRVNRFSHRLEDRPGFAYIRGRRVDFRNAGDVYLSTHQGRAAWEALSLEVNRKVDQGFGLLCNATLGSAWDTNTHEPTQDLEDGAITANPADPGSQWAPSAYDSWFRLHLVVSYAHPRGFQGALTAHFQSPAPVTLRDFLDLNGDGLRNDASPGLGGRNGTRLWGRRSLDARLSQRLPGPWGRARAEALVEVYNLFNWANLRSSNLNASYNGYPITAFGEANLVDRHPRSLRVGLQVIW